MYGKQLGRAMNHGQSFIPGRFGRRVRPEGATPQAAQTPSPTATQKRPRKVSALMRAILPKYQAGPPLV